MSDDNCRNDCTLPLRFPRRPGTEPPSAHGDGCLCCNPAERISQDNRPALSHFNYRIGTYGSIREYLFHQINRTPQLEHWTHRAPDDPAVALLEGASILGDILAFYQETYANEAFLRTAKWRESISDLVRLLGYRLSPAVGGNAVFAFELKKDEPVIIPIGFPVRATLEKLEKPANFETTEEITAYPWLSRFSLYKPLVQKNIEHSTNEFYISFPEQLIFPVELKPGDRLMVGEPVDKAGPVGVRIPSASEIEAGNKANAHILELMTTALVVANNALVAVETSVGADSDLIGKAEKAGEIAAGDAAMRSVSEAIGKLVREEENAWAETNSGKGAADAAVEEASTLANETRNIANGNSLYTGVAAADIQSMIAMVATETEAIRDAARAVSTAVQESMRKMRAAETLILGLSATARTAATSEADSKEANRLAAEAANKAVRLAAIAASSAAAGASDRVDASSLATQADAAAQIAKDDADLVPGYVKTFRDTTYGDFFAIAAFIAITAGAGLPLILLTYPALERSYNTAHDKATDTQSDTVDVKTKTGLVVNALSASTTAAATQSGIDRAAALLAVTAAETAANTAAQKAAQMVHFRAVLLLAINNAMDASVAAKIAAVASVEAIGVLIAAIRALDTETIGESVMVSGDVLDDKANPARLKNAEVVIVDSIRELYGEKIFKIKGDLKRTDGIGKLSAFKIGRSFHHFGYNGDPTTTKTDEPLISTATSVPENDGTTTTVTSPPIPERAIAFSRLLGSTTVSDEHAIRMRGSSNAIRIVDPPLGKLEFPLEAEVNNLTAGMTMVIQATLFGSANARRHEEFTMVRKITEIKPLPVTWGLSTGGTSMLTLDRPLTVNTGDTHYRIADIRDFMLHEAVSPLLTIKRAKEDTDEIKGRLLNFYGTADEAMTLKERRIMLEKAVGEPYLNSVSSVPSFFKFETAKYPQLRPITLADDVSYADFPNEDPAVTVFGNLVNADEGKTLSETPIGSGDATLVFQNFKLPKAPLTYHIVPENTPSETPEADVYVDGRLWVKVDSFFGRGADEHIYIVREDARGNSWVQFGDGKTGARLTNGVKNATAVYRIGDGAYGPIKEDTKVQALAKLKNLDKIQMPSDVTGGAPPEDGENARNAAPGKVQSLGRIVSLQDFESEATAIPGVASASAAWSLVGNIPSVVVTVLMETGRSTEIDAVRDTLNAYNMQRGAGRNAVQVVPGKRMYVMASVEYALKATYRSDIVEPAIRLSLGVNYGKATRDEDQTGLFSLRRRRFGSREYSSSVEGWVQNVEGVLWAQAAVFIALADSDDPAAIVVPSTSVLDPVVGCDGEHILSLFDKHLMLTAVAGEGS